MNYKMKTKILSLFIAMLAMSISAYAQTEVKFNKKLIQYTSSLSSEFNKISSERQKSLQETGDFIFEDLNKTNKAQLKFICTSNSRRSHLAQVWMQTASMYYGIDSVLSFSGGTEATEVNSRAVAALNRAGFIITRGANNYNSPYSITAGRGISSWIIYSKKHDDLQNPTSGFIAVMVCSEADKSCPVVSGSNGRIGLPYDDPKYYDNTPSESAKYDETTRLIAREMFFVADYVKTKLILQKEKEQK